MKHLDEITHQYYNDAGEQIPSVTQIISIINKQGIVQWANAMGFKRINAEKFMNEKAIVGSLLHDRISKFLKKEEYQPHLSTEINEKVDELFTQFMRWYNMANPTVIFSEETYINDKYGGTIDLICGINRLIYLIDFKTSKKVHTTHLIQLGGYLNLLKELDPGLYKDIDRCQILTFTPTNIYTEMREKRDMKKYETIFENSYILYKEYDRILREEWNTSMRELKIKGL